MRLFCDLHIHSCLSPCGDELMTPNNIAGMAMLKGLDAIAVADHNSARNLPALSRTCAAMGVLLLPAMELTTAEEVHLLSYFPTVEAALDFSEELHGCLPPIQNRPDIFGPQQVLDEDDAQGGSEDLPRRREQIARPPLQRRALPGKHARARSFLRGRGKERGSAV